MASTLSLSPKPLIPLVPQRTQFKSQNLYPLSRSLISFDSDKKGNQVELSRRKHLCCVSTPKQEVDVVGKTEKGREIEFLVRELGWGVRKLYRVGEEVRMAAYVQAEAFYEPMGIFMASCMVFLKTRQAEVLSDLMNRLRNSASDSSGYSKMTEATLENGSQKPITRVLFCGLNFPSSQNFTIEYLQKYPFIQVDAVPLEKVPEVIHQYHLCVVKMCRFDSALIGKASQMKLLVQFGVGLEGVDIEAATRSKIKVARIPGNVTGNSLACAELSIYLILGLLRKQKEMEIAVKQRELGVPAGDTLFGKTVFILGFGAIGVDLAKRLRPFGVKILATKRKWPSDGLVDKKGTPEDMYEFAGEADIVVTCLSLNKETAGIVDAKFVSSMKKGSLLVNIARGGILDYDAVYQHLKTGHLGGLGIDVAWFEPLDPDDPILKLPNVLITPHVGGVTQYSYRAMAKVVGDCALQLHEGKPFTGIEFVN